MNQNICAGIDEAGRGPVIGPMVVAGVSIPRNHKKHLRGMGVKDSKNVSRRKRQRLAKYITKKYGTVVHVISAYTITNLMQDGVSLNDIEKRAMKSIVYALPTCNVTIDSPVREGRWKNDFPQNVALRHKADETHIEVSAASIVAKTVRDRYMDRLPCNCSGYPSDPLTQDVLAKATMHEPYIRYTWKTVANEMARRSQDTLSTFL